MLTDVNLTGEAREAYMEAIAKKSVNLSQDERRAFSDALMRESAQATEAKQNRTYSQRGDDYLIEAQRLCAEDKQKPQVVCPYCGTPMVEEERIEGASWYECYKCGATAPTEETEQAAMQRWNGSSEEIAVEPKYKYWPVKISSIEVRY